MKDFLKIMILVFVVGMAACSLFSDGEEDKTKDKPKVATVVKKKIDIYKMQETTENNEKKIKLLQAKMKKELFLMKERIERSEQNVIASTYKATIYFKFDGINVANGGLTDIEKTVNLMKKYPKMKLKLAGHSDAHGDELYNLDLSVKRAESVKALLIENGISPDRIETEGHGETQLVADSDQFNRRVEVSFIT